MTAVISRLANPTIAASSQLSVLGWQLTTDSSVWGYNASKSGYSHEPPPSFVVGYSSSAADSACIRRRHQARQSANGKTHAADPYAADSGPDGGTLFCAAYISHGAQGSGDQEWGSDSQ